ncbi:MAG: hypothetical protein JO022_21580, partial [Acidobacteriaceae bacterium]|nr:hypothetical protein [Acidobacteriaceae bacterium]
MLRASVQSITIDEADSYIGGVLQDWPSQWYPTSGNHVLNTILMRLLTWIFGMSHLSARGPALIGAAVYIVASYRICRLVTEDGHLRVAALVCLVYNPFVMDYMVAARGYSLAMAFLMSAIFLVLREFLDTRRERWPRTAALVSAFVALSFSANFSFAYIDVLCLILFTAWAAQGIYRSEGWRPAIRLIAAAVWPGLLVLLVFSLSVVVA